MPTVQQVLRNMRFNRTYGLSDEGSCFGVSDPSRLRDSQPRADVSIANIPNLCDGCFNREVHQRG